MILFFYRTLLSCLQAEKSGKIDFSNVQLFPTDALTAVVDKGGGDQRPILNFIKKTYKLAEDGSPTNIVIKKSWGITD